MAGIAVVKPARSRLVAGSRVADSSAGRVAGQRGRRGPRDPAVVDHVDDDHGDVVATPALVGEAHELGGRLRRVVEAAQDAGDLVGADLVEQPVGAEEEPVARHRVDRPEVDVDALVDAQHPGDDVALRVDLGLFGGDAAVAHQVGDHAVVLGELHQLAVAVEVRPAVADVGDDEVLGGGLVLLLVVTGRRPVGLLGQERQGDDGGAHAAEVRVGVALVADAVVGDRDGLGERVGGGLLVRDLERLDGEARRHLAALVAAHPVGDTNRSRSGRSA